MVETASLFHPHNPREWRFALLFMNIADQWSIVLFLASCKATSCCAVICFIICKFMKVSSSWRLAPRAKHVRSALGHGNQRLFDWLCYWLANYTSRCWLGGHHRRNRQGKTSLYRPVRWVEKTGSPRICCARNLPHIQQFDSVFWMALSYVQSLSCSGISFK